MAQSTLQFLNSVLSQRGPNALPYADNMEWYIRQHLLDLTETQPNLTPQTAVFIHKDGRTVNLLQAEGTVLVFFRSVTYNILVVIWLMESYPRHAPLVFVNPTRDMIIKRPHPFVSPNGVVSIPYLDSWAFPDSNLVELGKNLSHIFARDPPLFSLHKSSNHNPNLNRSYGSMNYEVFKKNAIAKLVERLEGLLGAQAVLRKREEDLRKGLKEIQDEKEAFKQQLKMVRMNTTDVLRKREEDLRKGLKEMQDEKEALKQQLKMVRMNTTDVLEGWLRENEGKMGNNDGVDVDVDEAFESCDGLSKQMSDCTASDLDVEDDAKNALDKAVQEGVITFDQHLRNVRSRSGPVMWFRRWFRRHFTSRGKREKNYLALPFDTDFNCVARSK